MPENALASQTYCFRRALDVRHLFVAYLRLFSGRLTRRHEIDIYVSDFLLTQDDHIAALYGLTLLCSADTVCDHPQALCVFHTQFCLFDYL